MGGNTSQFDVLGCIESFIACNYYEIAGSVREDERSSLKIGFVRLDRFSEDLELFIADRSRIVGERFQLRELTIFHSGILRFS